MSNRSLLEINHDFYGELNTIAFRDALANYVTNPSLKNQEDLEQFGVRVFGIRHHSVKFEI